jgi:hypothetical protein
MLPEDICAWCFEVLDYHADNPIVDAGFSESELRELALVSFKELVEYVDFPYWRSPVLSKALLMELDLRDKDEGSSKELAIILASIPKRSNIKPLFETASHFFHYAGLEDLVPKGKGRGVRSISRCGHLCLSMGEREICEFLFSKKIPHAKEPLYCDHPNGSTAFGAMRGDFLVGDVVVEFAGLAGEESYDEKMASKERLALEHDISLIIVTQKDLLSLDTKLSACLQENS